MSEILANASNNVGANTALANILGADTAFLVESKYGDEKTFAGVSSGTFLPRVQLCGSNSNLCKKQKIGIGRFCVTNAKDVILHDLSDTFNCLVISWRPKAMRFAGSDTVAYYNPKSPFFKEVQTEADAKKQGSSYGPEYLVYLPEQKVFVTFYFMNPTMRREAPNMNGQLGKVAQVRSVFIEKEKFSWHGPAVTGCSTPVSFPSGDELPAFQAELKLQRDRFNTPPEEEVEEVPVDVPGEAARER